MDTPTIRWLRRTTSGDDAAITIQSILKRTMDLVLSLLALVLLSPLLLVITLAVRLTSAGPVLFRQRRLGRKGKPFMICKFRTMYVNSSEIRNPDGSTCTRVNDPRVTSVGQFLRRTSLDELPQLVNVLRGEMSLVGPRPDQVDQLQYYTEAEKRKLAVKPGMTGLAQISGRNNIAWTQRKQIDIDYVERQSFWLDLVIMLRTIPYVLSRRDVVEGTMKEAGDGRSG